MKHSFTLLISFFVMISLLCFEGQSVTKGNRQTEQYKLVWSDEFNTNGKPDTNNWNFEKSFVRNKELQWYQPDNAFCMNGKLIIEAKHERNRNSNYLAGSNDWRINREYAEYTSSSLLTRGLHSWLFGRFEMRAKIDTRSGLWPAFWTLGENGNWPHNGEVDIMEYYRNTVLANIAWGDTAKWKPIWDSFKLPLDSLNKSDPEWSQKFHIWKMDWDKDSIKLYLDDKVLNSVDLSTTINRDKEGKNPFWQPQYIIVNLAVGGTQGGDPSKTTFPANYEIDYIRVYQK